MDADIFNKITVVTFSYNSETVQTVHNRGDGNQNNHINMTAMLFFFFYNKEHFYPLKIKIKNIEVLFLFQKVTEIGCCTEAMAASKSGF